MSDRPDVEDLEDALGILEAEAEALDDSAEWQEFRAAVVDVGCHTRLRKDLESPESVEVKPYV